MPALSTIIRKTPMPLLKAYFENRKIVFVDPIDWDARESEVNRCIRLGVQALTGEDQAVITSELDRVAGLADDAGRAALHGVAEDQALLDNLENDYARAMWMFLNDAERFRYAEEARYTDEHRRGRSWDGYMVRADAELREDDAALDAFTEALKAHFGSANVQVDVFTRTRRSSDGKDHEVIQITVFREGLASGQLAFDNGELVHRSYRPVFESALTYEPKTRAIEVVGGGRENRAELARILAHHLLGVEFQGEKLPLLSYDLSPLLKPHCFPSDEEDRIASVELRQLRLMPKDQPGLRIVMECLSGSNQTIWEMAVAQFGLINPLNAHWIPTRAILNIKFRRRKGTSRSRNLPVAISTHGCDLKERNAQEQVIGVKYLRRWGLLHDV